MIRRVFASRVPVIVYVAPSGARAASAGTFLLYASTVAAMAPGTHLGAASPVSLIGGVQEEGKQNEKGSSTMHKKVMNDSVAYIKTLAELRGRNVDFAIAAVKDAQTMTAKEAKKANVINLISDDVNRLLKEIDGWVVEQAGRKIKLNTQENEVVSFSPDWRMKLLMILTDPTLAYLLLLLGIYGIFFELVNPGFIAPGVIGAVAMLIALYALQLLPISFAGLALLVLGMMFVIAESFVPSFGILGLGGAIAFVVGSILLMDTAEPAYQIAWSAIWAMAAANVIIFIVLVSMAMKARREPIQHGTSTLVGHVGKTITPVNLEGQASICGEIWWVVAKQPLKKNTPIRVTGADGLKLEIEALEGD